MNYEDTVNCLIRFYLEQKFKCVSEGALVRKLPEIERSKCGFLYNLSEGWNPHNMVVSLLSIYHSEDSITDIFQDYGNDSFYRSSFDARELAEGYVKDGIDEIDAYEASKVEAGITDAKTPKTILKERLAGYMRGCMDNGYITKELHNENKKITEIYRFYNDFTEEIKQRIAEWEQSKEQYDNENGQANRQENRKANRNKKTTFVRIECPGKMSDRQTRTE
jgi:hypothetical protein